MDLRSVLKLITFRALLMPKGKLNKDPHRSPGISMRISTMKTKVVNNPSCAGIG